jgi:hypothetical protein
MIGTAMVLKQFRAALIRAIRELTASGHIHIQITGGTAWPKSTASW